MDMDAPNESQAAITARRRFLKGFGAGLTATVLAGCTGDDPNADGTGTPDEIPKGGTLEVAAADDPQNLDPHTTTIDVAQMVLDNVVEGLFTLDGNLELQPVLATDHQLSDDETTYDIALKEDVTFHDGAEFTSADVKYSVERILDPDVGSPRAANFELVDGIETPDDHTVRFVLSKPFAPFMIGLAESASVIPEGSAEAKDPKRNPVGTGPFQLDGWEADETVSLAAFDGYHESDLPHLDGVKFEIVPEASTRLTQLRSGSAHVMFGVPFQQADSLDGGGTTLQSVNGLWKQSFWFNTDVEPFTDPAVRRAISHAIDRQKLVQGVLFGHGEVAHDPVPPASPWAKRIDTADANGFDRGKSESLLDEAGVDPASISATIKASRTPGPTYADTATLIQSMLSELGTNVDVQIMDFSTWLQEVWVDKNFELSVGSWSGRIDPDGWYYRQYHSDGEWNRWNYSNADVDGLLEEARTTTDEADRAELYGEVDGIVSREVPMTYLYFRREMTGLKNAVGNYELTATHQAEFDRTYVQQ